jgi:hypothetical protein
LGRLRFPARLSRRGLLLISGTVALVAVVMVGLTEPPTTRPGLPLGSASPLASEGGAELSPSPEASTPAFVDETGEGPEGRVPAALPDRIDLYAGAVSITPGQPVTLHVSTRARTYGFSIERLDATLPDGGQIVAHAGGRVGRDYRSLATFDRIKREARANWPVTDALTTSGWRPGVYIVTASDSAGTVGHAIFVVRTPTLRADEPAYVFSALTYEAYNLWGGANLYTYAAPRAVRVSFERPYLQAEGLMFWVRDDDRILAWLQLRGLPLQFTTDYDLSIAPPAVAPRLLIFPRHSEYVGAGLRDFVEEHVDTIGDMNVLNFGANSFYWQVRLAEPQTAGAPFDVVCYKIPTTDPASAGDPALTTIRWRDAPLLRPEGAVLGAQYVAVLGNGYDRYDYTVSPRMPAALLTGTGWRDGTVLHGLLMGEGDDVYPGSGGIAIMVGAALGSTGRPVATSVTIRTSPVGARIFDAGTFAWADGFAPAKVDLGVSVASFERFTRNVLAWLGFPTSR